MKTTLIVLLNLLTIIQLVAQTTYIKGVVLDKVEQTPISFCNVTLMKYNHIGTATNELGEFVLNLPFLECQDDTLAISSIGYKTFMVKASSVLNSQQSVFALDPKDYIIDPVTIKAPSEKAKRIVEQAIASKVTNFNPKRHVLFAFFRSLDYRMYDTSYNAMIEADVQILDYGIEKNHTNNRYIINQMRRSDDYRHPLLKSRAARITRINNNELINAYRLHMLKFNEGTGWFDENFLTQNNFYLQKQIIEINDTINVIGFTGKGANHYANFNLGIIHISQQSHAILSVEYEVELKGGSPRRERRFQQFGMGSDGYYYPKIMLYDSYGSLLYLYIHSISTERKVLRDFSKRKSRLASRDLFSINYDYNESFWENYNLPILAPVTEKQRTDLERIRCLREQFYNPKE